MKDLLQREVAQGMCVLMSTHTLAAAEEISDRVGIMNHGRLLFDGTVERVAAAMRAGESVARSDVSCRLRGHSGDENGMRNDAVVSQHDDEERADKPMTEIALASSVRTARAKPRETPACSARTARRSCCGGCVTRLAART